jgi:type III secretion HrpO family protein
MRPEDISKLASDALLLAITMSAPLVGAAAVIGLLFGFVQAVTQLQDQASIFAVKVVVIFVLLIVLGPWLGSLAFTYAERVMTLIVEVR